ncbi:TRIC cation channel family protein [Actinoplanes sp. NPDC049681]|uniref:TRIC cation channel family protein n=1 Tax=Actinoplanes sp. NPDC049681 TaxID=3363905 RepID=UPI00379A547F
MSIHAVLSMLELLGLFVFAVSGALTAVQRSFDAAGILILVQAAVPGVTTGVGGGLLRDVIARQTPALVKVDTDLYSIPAMVGAAAG